MTSPVTVLMTVYNGMPLLEEAVESVLGQTLTDWTLLIVNDPWTWRIFAPFSPDPSMVNPVCVCVPCGLSG